MIILAASFEILAATQNRLTGQFESHPEVVSGYAILELHNLLCGPVAQLGARFHGMEEVDGSNPSRSTNIQRTSVAPVPRKLQFLWELDSAGAGPGLQNRSAAYCVAGGFDSH